MSTHTLRVVGSKALGERISGLLLRDLLTLVANGASRALRMRVEGRSTAAGPKPAWLDPGSAFDFLGVSTGSSVVHLGAAPLADAAPTHFRQASFFLDNRKTAIELWRESLADALRGETDSDLFDRSMLVDFRNRLKQLFSHDVTELEVADGVLPAAKLVVRPATVAQIDRLERQTPQSRQVRVAGKLDVIRHSDRRLTLNLANGIELSCWAGEIAEDQLRSMWGQPVVVSGRAVFRPSGRVLVVESDHIVPATEQELELWSDEPAAPRGRA